MIASELPEAERLAASFEAIRDLADSAVSALKRNPDEAAGVCMAAVSSIDTATPALRLAVVAYDHHELRRAA